MGWTYIVIDEDGAIMGTNDYETAHESAGDFGTVITPALNEATIAGDELTIEEIPE